MLCNLSCPCGGDQINFRNLAQGEQTVTFIVCNNCGATTFLSGFTLASPPVKEDNPVDSPEGKLYDMPLKIENDNGEISLELKGASAKVHNIDQIKIARELNRIKKMVGNDADAIFPLIYELMTNPIPIQFTFTEIDVLLDCFDEIINDAEEIVYSLIDDGDYITAIEMLNNIQSFDFIIDIFVNTMEEAEELGFERTFLEIGINLMEIGCLREMLNMYFEIDDDVINNDDEYPDLGELKELYFRIRDILNKHLDVIFPIFAALDNDFDF